VPEDQIVFVDQKQGRREEGRANIPTTRGDAEDRRSLRLRTELTMGSNRRTEETALSNVWRLEIKKCQDSEGAFKKHLKARKILLQGKPPRSSGMGISERGPEVTSEDNQHWDNRLICENETIGVDRKKKQKQKRGGGKRGKAQYKRAGKIYSNNRGCVDIDFCK